MTLQFIQVASEARSMAQIISRETGLPQETALGMLVQMWFGLADVELGRLFDDELVLSQELVMQHIAPSLRHGEFVTSDEKRSWGMLELLIKVGVLEPREGGLYRIRGMSRYLKKREERAVKAMSSAERQKRYREKKKENDTASRNVTPIIEENISDTQSSYTTYTHLPDLVSCPTDIQPADSSRNPQEVQIPKKVKPPKPPKPPKETNPRHVEARDALLASFKRLRGTEYAFRGGKDAKHISDLLGFCKNDVGELVRVWETGLSSAHPSRQIHEIGQLVLKFNQLRGQAPETNFKPEVKIPVTWDANGNPSRPLTEKELAVRAKDIHPWWIRDLQGFDIGHAERYLLAHYRKIHPDSRAAKVVRLSDEEFHNAWVAGDLQDAS